MEHREVLLGIKLSDFGRQVKKFREDSGMTQQEFCSYLGGLSLNTIRNWEQGHTHPVSKLLIQKLRQMGVVR